MEGTLPTWVSAAGVCPTFPNTPMKDHRVSIGVLGKGEMQKAGAVLLQQEAGRFPPEDNDPHTANSDWQDVRGLLLGLDPLLDSGYQFNGLP